MKVKHVLLVVAAVFLILLLLIILLPIDDELDSDAAAWVEQANHIEDVEGNGYPYLMGFMSNPSHDPATAGRELIAAYRVTEQKLLSGEIDEFTQEEYPAERALLTPEGEYYCNIDEPGCFAKLATNPAALHFELSEHFVLLLRYQTFVQFEQMKFLLEPTLYERFPPYMLLLRGHKLNQFKILLESLEGKPEQAISMLHEDMAQLRRQLATAPSLLSKMTMLSMLESDLDLLFNLTRPAGEPGTLTALTPEERAMQAAMTREFGSLANFHKQMDLNPRSVGLDGYGWLIRPTIKPNMTLNSLFPYYRDIAALALVDASDFMRAVEAGSEPKVNTEFRLRNIGGSILTSISAPSLTGYIARLHDVDCKIVLLNAALELDPPAWNKILKGETELQANNPYNSSWRPYVDQETQALCFKGPLGGSRHRCIRKDHALLVQAVETGE